MLVNGITTSSIPANDRGLLYGDGLFETLAIKNGVLCQWGRHMNRLRSGCERLGLSPQPDESQLLEEAQSLAGDIDWGVLRITLTAGPAERGYRRPDNPSLTRILSLSPGPGKINNHKSSGIKLGLSTIKLSLQPALAGIKHLNRLEQILARREADGKGYFESVMCDESENVIEAISANLFILKNGRMYTPSLETSGVAGIARQLILEESTRTITPIKEQTCTLNDLYEADSLFLSNSVSGVIPVSEFDGASYNPKYWASDFLKLVDDKVYRES